MSVTLRGVDWVKFTLPLSGASSRAERVFAASSQPLRIRPTSPSARSSWKVLPILTAPTPAAVIRFAAA